MRVSATMDSGVEWQYHDFLHAVEEYLRPLPGCVVRVVELEDKIQQPPDMHHVFPSFSHALRADPMARFEFAGSEDLLSVQLAAAQTKVPAGPQTTGSPRKEHENGIMEMDEETEPLRSVSSSSFVCPITQEEMRDPVIAADGFTYERTAIEQWLSKCKRSPSTNNDLRSTVLVPNRILKQIMEDSTEVDVGGGFASAIPQRSYSCPTPSCQHWSSPAKNCRFPADGQEGLCVYEIVSDVVVAFTGANDIESVEAAGSSNSPISGWIFLKGQLISSCLRQANAANIDVVEVEHGLGWLCAAHLRAVQIEPELRVFQVTCDNQLGKRAIPDNRRAFMRPSAGCAVRHGQVLSSSQSITGKDGTIYLRVDGGWVPDRKFSSKGEAERLMTELKVKERAVVYKVVSKCGLSLRAWPCHLSAKVEPAVTVDCGVLVGSRARVRGEHRDVYIHVEVGGVKGWLFASREGETTMQRLPKRPQVHEESPGECVQCQLGPRGGWVLAIDEPGGGPGEAVQTLEWQDITPGLARQLGECKAKGMRVVQVVMSADGKGWLCEAEQPDGTGGHVWGGGMGPELKEAMFAEGVEQLALGTDHARHACGVAWSEQAAVWAAHNVSHQDLKDLQKARAERLCLLPLGQFWAGCAGGREFWRLHNRHLEEEIRATANVLAVTQCPQTGAWLVIADECVRCSRGLPPDLEQRLAHFYARRKAQRAQEQREAELYDAVLARFPE